MRTATVVSVLVMILSVCERADAGWVQGRTQTLAASLASRIRGAVARADVAISSDGRKAIDELAAAGARKLVQEESEANLNRANQNADSVGRALVDLAKKERGDVTAATVASARKDLCPLYPFC